MTKEGKGRVVAVGKAKTRYITVPSNVASDDRFPFTDGEEVMVTIQADKKSLAITKVE
jgi:co-chaperonin GroES (HSP10)